ncbi:hypothetical protein D3C87_78340 [compost metagenome]
MEVEDIMNVFLVTLNLYSPHRKYKIRSTKFNNSIGYKLFELQGEFEHDFLLFVDLCKESVVVTINKNKFKNGIVFNYKLRNYEIDSEYLEHKMWKREDSGQIWTIKSNSVQVVYDVISVINKKIQ